MLFSRRESFLGLFFVVVLLTSHASARLFSADSVAAGKLPDPIADECIDYDVLQIGAGTGGGISSTFLAYAGFRVLVLDDGFPVSYNDTTNGIIPGNEYNGGYYFPGLENEIWTMPNAAIDAEHNGYGIPARKIRGGDQRLSHYAIELGNANDHRALMYEPLGRPAEWDPTYIWGYVANQLFNFSGPHITQNHQNLGRIRVQESRECAWQSSAISSCAATTGGRAIYDFNTLDGGYQTCSAEPSNVQTNGLRSNSETEYMLRAARDSNDFDVVRDAKVTRILFDTSSRKKDPVAIGVEGLFRNRPFRVRFSSASDTAGCGAKKQHKSLRSQGTSGTILLSSGAYNNPQLLKLSGVGPREELSKWNIPIVSDLPAVGEYLKDGNVAYIGWFSNATAEEIGLSPNNSDLITSRPGGFVSLNNGDSADEMLWLMTPSNWGTFDSPFVVGYGLTFQLQQPVNGSVRLITPNMGDVPKIDYAWDDSTVAQQVRFLKKARQMVLDGGMADRFQFYEFFPGQSASDFIARNSALRGVHVAGKFTSTTKLLGQRRAIAWVASTLLNADMSTAENRVRVIEDAVSFLMNAAQEHHHYPLSQQLSVASVRQAVWMMWYMGASRLTKMPHPARIAATNIVLTLPQARDPFKPYIASDMSRIGAFLLLGDEDSEKDASVFYDDDAVLANAVRTGSQAELHASGTTRMTNNDRVRGVVDTNFDVYGVRGLKTCGMSVMPYLPGAGGQTWAYISCFIAQNKIRAQYGVALA